jgi:hypothetical protein
MSAKFLADANLDLVILAAAKRREPGLDFQTAQDTGSAGLEDLDVLAVAAQAGRVFASY